MLRMSSLLSHLSIASVTSNIGLSISNPAIGATIIGTHDGTFHCDEVLAMSMLSLLPQYQNQLTILRTRNPQYFPYCSVLVDVGAVYDPANHRYDHHQREFVDTLYNTPEYKIKLSSAGLVYKHFGTEIIDCVLKAAGKIDISSEFLTICYTKLYKDFIEHIDAIDNGIAVTDSEVKYHISTTLSFRIGQMNPQWNEPQSPEEMNRLFKEAMKVACSEFITNVLILSDSWWPARSFVQKAMSERFSIHNSGKIIVLDQACPWKDHLFDLEIENDNILFVIYQDKGGSYRIQAVPVSPNSFVSRLALPKEWCGLRDDILSTKCGVEGCIFVHANGFIGGNISKDGAIQMAIQAIQIESK